ncbi:MAG: hypothetical protein HY209_07250 [Candidatus Omnitrophica bacterium]|nr:hypothetical protein [Candidatus Omnitrophota bacterium]
MRKIFLMFILAGILTGCSIYQIDFRNTSQNYYPPKTNIDQVQYMEKVDRPFEVIGVATVTTERRQLLKDILPKLKQEAAILGGDAISDIQTNATGIWKKIKPQKLFGNAYIRATYSAKVIVFK